jgi:hypothetical protein
VSNLGQEMPAIPGANRPEGADETTDKER